MTASGVRPDVGGGFGCLGFGMGAFIFFLRGHEIYQSYGHFDGFSLVIVQSRLGVVSF